ncbi:MAG: hypothetical protein NT090_01000, partial [Acidobacteria bacterium]|nr:hypothetical protein [Acidobacteriota bacterium]
CPKCRTENRVDQASCLSCGTNLQAMAEAARLRGDKKTVHGKVHFVLPVEIGKVRIVSGLDEKLVLEAIRAALA